MAKQTTEIEHLIESINERRVRLFAEACSALRASLSEKGVSQRIVRDLDDELVLAEFAAIVSSVPMKRSLEKLAQLEKRTDRFIERIEKAQEDFERACDMARKQLSIARNWRFDDLEDALEHADLD